MKPGASVTVTATATATALRRKGRRSPSFHLGVVVVFGVATEALSASASAALHCTAQQSRSSSSPGHCISSIPNPSEHYLLFPVLIPDHPPAPLRIISIRRHSPAVNHFSQSIQADAAPKPNRSAPFISPVDNLKSPALFSSSHRGPLVWAWTIDSQPFPIFLFRHLFALYRRTLYLYLYLYIAGACACSTPRKGLLHCTGTWESGNLLKGDQPIQLELQLELELHSPSEAPAATGRDCRHSPFSGFYLLVSCLHQRLSLPLSAPATCNLQLACARATLLHLLA